MKILTIITVVIIGILLLVFMADYFKPYDEEEPYSDVPALVHTIPPEYFNVPSASEINSRQDAAEHLWHSMQSYPEHQKFTLQFKDSGNAIMWLIDLNEASIIERETSPRGTIIQIIWKGNINRRIDWCRSNGDLAAENLAPPVKKNLYH